MGCRVFVCLFNRGIKRLTNTHLNFLKLSLCMVCSGFFISANVKMRATGNKGSNMRLLLIFLIKGEKRRKRTVLLRKADFKRSPSRLRREEIL